MASSILPSATCVSHNLCYHNHMEKICSVCLEPADDFPPRRSMCRLCYNKRQAEYRARPENQESLRASWRKASKGYYHKDPRGLGLRKKYGITTKQYLSMYGDQQGRCKICAKEFEMLCVDHDHETKTVRGLLCHRCNLGLGHFEDDLDRLQAAMLYLELAR